MRKNREQDGTDRVKLKEEEQNRQRKTKWNLRRKRLGMESGNKGTTREQTRRRPTGSIPGNITTERIFLQNLPALL
jgi:hypothetical protein